MRVLEHFCWKLWRNAYMWNNLDTIWEVFRTPSMLLNNRGTFKPLDYVWGNLCKLTSDQFSRVYYNRTIYHFFFSSPCSFVTYWYLVKHCCRWMKPHTASISRIVKGEEQENWILGDWTINLDYKWKVYVTFHTPRLPCF